MCLFTFVPALICAQTASRQVINLDQGWRFGLSNVTKPTEARPFVTKSITIPHTWNNRDIQSGGKFHTGGGWYERHLLITENELKTRELFLKFDAVSSVADVYVNNRFLGKHKGGFSAFCFDATPLLRVGDNLIDVRADNTPRPDVIPINMALFPLFGGIYRHVWLVSTPKVCISPLEYASPGIFVTEKNVSAKSATLWVKVDLQNFTPDFQTRTIEIVIDSHSNKLKYKTKENITIPSGPIHPITLNLPLKHPHLWQGRHDPYLYTLKVILGHGAQRDTVNQKIGIRKFSIVPGKGFFLNGKPYRLYGVTRHQDRKNQGNAVSDQEQRQDAAMIDDIGATAVRLSHYQQADVIYRTFDKDGIIVWAESPFVNSSSGKEAMNALQQFRELILQNYNHASIAFWGCCNEVYGRTAQSYVPSLIRKLVNEGHELDSTRFICATSGTGNPFGAEVSYADVQGMNRYYGWYQGKTSELAQWLNHMKKVRPGLIYALTEYGAGANIHQQSETLPSHVNPTGPFFPENYQTELHKKSWLIIKKHPELVASFVWTMFDFAVPGWNRGGQKARNMKGLVTYDRTVKKDAFYWYKANWSNKPVLHILERRVINRHISPMMVEVFCNKGRPHLVLNGSPLPPMHQGVNRIDWILNGVHLRLGTNILHASITVDGKTLTDTVSWNYAEPK